jgi:hypothetical protein
MWRKSMFKAGDLVRVRGDIPRGWRIGKDVGADAGNDLGIIERSSSVDVHTVRWFRSGEATGGWASDVMEKVETEDA